MIFQVLLPQGDSSWLYFLSVILSLKDLFSNFISILETNEV
jgi:hypothetical protein